jgi:hypothetical protein
MSLGIHEKWDSDTHSTVAFNAVNCSDIDAVGDVDIR